MVFLRNLAVPLLAFTVQTFVANASPLSLLGNDNNDVSLLPTLDSAPHLNDNLWNINLTGNLSNLINEFHLTSLALKSTTLNLTLPGNEEDLECLDLGTKVYGCTDHTNNATVIVERMVPEQPVPQSQFDTFLEHVVDDIDSLIRSLGKEKPRTFYANHQGSLSFISVYQGPTAAGPLRLRHILAAARIIQAENTRVGGPVTVGFVTYDFVPGGGNLKIGSGLAGRFG